MVDQTKIEEAVRMLLEGIGEDVNREGLQETPERISRMYGEIFAGMEEDAGEHLTKTFAVASNEIVVVKNITFYSICEHHLMPFYGRAHIAYLPDGKVVGLSKLARAVEVYARRPQIQEQMTVQIVEAVMEHLKPQGAIVMMEAEHLCMTMRGVEKPGSRTMTLASRGCFQEDPRWQELFFRLIKEDKMYNQDLAMWDPVDK